MKTKIFGIVVAFFMILTGIVAGYWDMLESERAELKSIAQRAFDSLSSSDGDADPDAMPDDRNIGNGSQVADAGGETDASAASASTVDTSAEAERNRSADTDKGTPVGNEDPSGDSSASGEVVVATEPSMPAGTEETEQKSSSDTAVDPADASTAPGGDLELARASSPAAKADETVESATLRNDGDQASTSETVGTASEGGQPAVERGADRAENDGSDASDPGPIPGLAVPQDRSGNEAESVSTKTGVSGNDASDGSSTNEAGGTEAQPSDKNSVNQSASVDRQNDLADTKSSEKTAGAAGETDDPPAGTSEVSSAPDDRSDEAAGDAAPSEAARADRATAEIDTPNANGDTASSDGTGSQETASIEGETEPDPSNAEELQVAESSETETGSRDVDRSTDETDEASNTAGSARGADQSSAGLNDSDDDIGTSTNTTVTSAESAETAVIELPRTPDQPGAAGVTPTDTLRFDVLRVEPDGSMVVAGNGPANATIYLEDAGERIGSDTSGPGGDFVVILSDGLGVGPHAIKLVSEANDGTKRVSRETAIIDVPDRGEEEKLLAMVEAPDQPSRLIDIPKANGDTDARSDAGSSDTSTPEGAGEDNPTRSQTDTASNGPDERSENQSGSSPSVQNSGDIAADPATDATSPETKGMAPSSFASRDQSSPSAQSDEGTDVVLLPRDRSGDGQAEPQAAPEALRIEAIEIEGDRIFVAGAAPAGTGIRIYLDNESLAEASANGSGRFLIEAASAIAVGDHTVRVDQIDGNGTVVARVAVPFLRPDAGSMSAVSPTVNLPSAERSERSGNSNSARNSQAPEPGDTSASRTPPSPPSEPVPSGDNADDSGEDATERQPPSKAAGSSSTSASSNDGMVTDRQDGVSASQDDTANTSKAVSPNGRQEDTGSSGATERRSEPNTPGEQDGTALSGTTTRPSAARKTTGSAASSSAADPSGSGDPNAPAASSNETSPSSAAARSSATSGTIDMASEELNTDDNRTFELPEASARSGSSTGSPASGALRGTELAEALTERQPDSSANEDGSSTGTSDTAASSPSGEPSSTNAPDIERSISPDGQTPSETASRESATANSNGNGNGNGNGNDISAGPTQTSSAETAANRRQPQDYSVPTRIQAPLESRSGRVLIRKGDTLWRISRQNYGEGLRYTVIYLANGDQIQNPDLIFPGQIFRMPSKSTAEANGPKAEAGERK